MRRFYQHKSNSCQGSGFIAVELKNSGFSFVGHGSACLLPTRVGCQYLGAK
jgi:hypothetical protein